MNKQKLKNRKQNSKNRKIRQKEQEDTLGIRRRRKGDKPELDIEIFYYIKLSLIIGIIISYFFFSTLLLPMFIGLSSLYLISFWVERKLNRSNSGNKKRVFKMDAAMAFITIIVSVSTTLYSFSTMTGSRFNSISSYITRLMSLSTGVRKKGNNNFGFAEKPEGFVKPEGATRPSGGRPQRPDFDMSDLPIEFAFNQILSSIVQFLILSVIIISSITVIIYFYNKYVKFKKIKIKQNEKNQWTFSKEDLIKLLEEQV